MKTTLFKILFTSVLLSVVFMGKSFANAVDSKSSGYTLSKTSTTTNSNYDNRRKLRIGFTASSSLHRQLLLTEDENATSGIDWGYDGECYESNFDDMYWLIQGQLFTIQGTDDVNESSNFPIGFHILESGNNTIRIDGLENFSDEFNFYLYDKELDIYHNLRESSYEFFANSGTHLDRFELTFREPQGTDDALSVKENELKDFKIYYNSTANKITLNNTSNTRLKALTILNITGQLVYNYSLNDTSTKQEIQLNTQQAKGTYIVLINTELGIISKKVILY
jgi:hypothetical protein